MSSPGFLRVVVQFDCHSEQAFFGQRGIWASHAKRRVLCDATIARLARFLVHEDIAKSAKKQSWNLNLIGDY
jgi:hypothetical protein